MNRKTTSKGTAGSQSGNDDVGLSGNELSCTGSARQRWELSGFRRKTGTGTAGWHQKLDPTAFDLDEEIAYYCSDEEIRLLTDDELEEMIYG